MEQEDDRFIIRKKYHDECLRVMKDSACNTSEMGGGSSTGECWYCWVDMTKLAQSEDLKEAFRAWRWIVDVTKNGDIDGIEFNGEKLGDDEFLFSTIAPYVEDGSYIQMRGEDGSRWRWYWINGNLLEDNVKTFWDSDSILGLTKVDHVD